MIEWVDQARRSIARAPTAMITILAAEGSAPRGAGTRMIVSTDVFEGTIGGGQLEFRACQQARSILELAPGTWRIQDYPLGPLLGQCCGGRVRLLIEHLGHNRCEWLDVLTDGSVLVTRLNTDRIERSLGDTKTPITAISARGERPDVGTILTERLSAARRPLYLFGAGHVGQAIACAIAPLPFSLAWFDGRATFGNLPGVFFLPEDELPRCAREAPAEAALLILTHDHGLDYELTSAALSGEAAFVGLIGSATKRSRFLSRLAGDGIDASRLTCPIGLPGIAGKEPEIIAAATAAQLLLDRQAE